MTDTTHYTLQILASDKAAITELLPESLVKKLNDCDHERVYNVGTTSQPVFIQSYDYYARTGQDEDALFSAIADMLIPVTLSDDGIFCEDPPRVRHARLREDGKFVQVSDHPACEDKVDKQKVVEAYMLGQVENLIETLRYEDNSWPVQLAILKKAGRK